MPSLLLHLCAVEELAGAPDLLSPPLSRALREDLEYARLGTALPDLPRYEGVRGGLQLLLPRRGPSPYAQLFHQRFETRGRAPARTTAAPFVQLTAGADYDFGSGYYLALDLAAETHFLPIAHSPDGSEHGPVSFALRPRLATGKRF